MAGERTMTATGRILGLQHSSTVDGPGTRSAVLFKGCSPACAWCRSAESRSTETEIWFLPGRCIACDSCLEVCPQARVTQADGLPAVGSAYCTRCGSCVEACTTGARTLAGRETTVEELLAEVESQRPIYAGSGGGVTFSGGEPLRQPEFLRACLEVFRERGIPTAVHTQGYEPADLLRGLAPLSDLFLYDLKLIDDVRHAALTGVPATPILRNLEALVATGAEI
jgi:pyruvate formate lyase activating enzyme